MSVHRVQGAKPSRCTRGYWEDSNLPKPTAECKEVKHRPRGIHPNLLNTTKCGTATGENKNTNTTWTIKSTGTIKMVFKKNLP